MKVENNLTLKNISLNTNKAVEGERIGIQTKRHKETPLPKILSLKSQSISKVQVATTNSGVATQKYSKKSLEKTASRQGGALIRPKDLPGYKNF